MSTNYAMRVNAWGAGTATAFTGTSTAAVALGAGLRFVFIADQTCHVIFGKSDVAAATTSVMPVPPLTYVSLDVPPGATHFRVIRNATSGTLWWAPVI